MTGGSRHRKPAVSKVFPFHYVITQMVARIDAKVHLGSLTHSVNWHTWQWCHPKHGDNSRIKSVDFVHLAHLICRLWLFNYQSVCEVFVKSEY